MIELIRDASPADLIEVGFKGAYDVQSGYHAKWRVVQKHLEAIRGNGTPHDAGDGDVYFDLILRQMEDEQAQYMRSTGEGGHPHSRTRIQIQLTRYWLVSVGEMLRATRNRVKDPALHARMTELVDRFGAIRMMVAKQEVQRHGASPLDTVLSGVLIEGMNGSNEMSCERTEAPKGYQVRPIMNRENGSICFPVYDAAGNILWNDDRRSLSDLILDEFSK